MPAKRMSGGQVRLDGLDHLGGIGQHDGPEAADHLTGLGHRRLAVVGVPDSMPLDAQGPVVQSRRGFKLRVTGFVAAAAASGIDPASITVVTAWNNSTDAGAEAARTLLQSTARPTAVFAVSDVLALGVLGAAAGEGLEVPADLSVVGFDGIDEAARSRPSLTTIAQDLRGQGRWAARTALNLVEGIRPPSSRNPPVLVIRSSTSPPKRRR